VGGRDRPQVNRAVDRSLGWMNNAKMGFQIYYGARQCYVCVWETLVCACVCVCVCVFVCVCVCVSLQQWRCGRTGGLGPLARCRAGTSRAIGGERECVLTSSQGVDSPVWDRQTKRSHAWKPSGVPVNSCLLSLLSSCLFCLSCLSCLSSLLSLFRFLLMCCGLP